MAGGKETPRQKMIGMMYLVLTALLALQVSSAIIQKFVFLDNSLMHVNGQSNHENHTLQMNIKKVVEQDNNSKYQHVVTKAESVRKQTEEMIAYIDKIRKDLIDVSGGYDDDGSYKGAKEEEKISHLMVGVEGKKDGEAYKLKEKLNKYSEFLTSFGIEVPKLALDGSEDVTVKKDKDQARKDFAQLNFAETPMVAALAVLAQKQSEVLKYENEVLSHLATEVGAEDIKFDNVSAMVRPASKVVAAGTKYEADMFLAASSSAITPTMTHDGRSIQVDNKSKMGKVTFTATGGAYDKEGLVKKIWTGTIRFKFKGKDTAFPVKEEYYVARPAIQIQSASVSALYKNCGNELNVQVPALGSAYNPSFSASAGTTVIKGSEKGKVTIIPTTAKSTLNVASGGFAIGSQEFNVRLIPKPTIELQNNGKKVDEKNGMPASGLGNFLVKALPEEHFKTFLPKDARYRVTTWDVYLVRGKRLIASKTISGEFVSMGEFRDKAMPGDRILVEVKGDGVQRKNFQDQVENVNVGTVYVNVPII